MKKEYKAPKAELVKFQYSDQVVASSGGKCQVTNIHHGGPTCAEGDPVYTL